MIYYFKRNFLAKLVLIFFAVACASSDVLAETVKVGLLLDSPPLSFMDKNGVMQGYNVEVAREICKNIGAACSFQNMYLSEVMSAISDKRIDFSAVALVATPERKRLAFFASSHLNSVSVWLARPGLHPGDPEVNTVVLKGSVQAEYALRLNWSYLEVLTQSDIVYALLSNRSQAAFLALAAASDVIKRTDELNLHLKPSAIRDSSVSGMLQMPVRLDRPDLLVKINGAIDKMKADGRLDRIGSKYLPFPIR